MLVVDILLIQFSLFNLFILATYFILPNLLMTETDLMLLLHTLMRSPKPVVVHCLSEQHIHRNAVSSKTSSG